jgi:hypothetical protein
MGFVIVSLMHLGKGRNLAHGSPTQALCSEQQKDADAECMTFEMIALKMSQVMQKRFETTTDPYLSGKIVCFRKSRSWFLMYWKLRRSVEKSRLSDGPLACQPKHSVG